MILRRSLPSLLPARAAVSWITGGIVMCAVICLLIVQLRQQNEPPDPESSLSPILISEEPIQPIRQIPGLDLRKVELGRKLFAEPRLSRDNTVSCASCHDLSTGGTDRRTRSIGINGAVGVINAPTVLNSAFNFTQFWDGRAPGLEEQIDEPIQSRIEMGSNWSEVIQKLNSSPDYIRAFRQIYGNNIQSGFIKNSIAEYERSLSTPNSRFDRYLRHEGQALTVDEQHGYQLFKSLGCASCHQGVNVGGNMYQKLGVMTPYFTNRSHVNRSDLGRFNVTGDPKDLYMFKVPSLRNVALTAPYFHDGSVSTLPGAIRAMAQYQLGRNLADAEVELIVSFLRTLTGEINGKRL